MAIAAEANPSPSSRASRPGGADPPFPVVIHRLDGFQALHTASLEAVRALLPSTSLHPVQAPNGRAMIAVGAFQKREATAGVGDAAFPMPPYAEVMVSALVAQHPLTRATSLLAAAGLGRSALGAFVLHLPLTSRAWCDAGRMTGVPMFVADLAFDFARPDGLRTVRVSENGVEVLALGTRLGGLLRTSHAVTTALTVHEGQLLAAPMELFVVAQERPLGGVLALGYGHPVAEGLRRLDISRRALMVGTIHSGRAVLGEASPIAAARPYTGYVGAERDHGRHLVRYPGLPWIDQGPA